MAVQVKVIKKPGRTIAEQVYLPEIAKGLSFTHNQREPKGTKGNQREPKGTKGGQRGQTEKGQDEVEGLKKN